MHNYFLSHAQVPQLLLFCAGITALSHKTHTWATIHLLMRPSLEAVLGEVASTISYIKWSVVRRRAPEALTLYYYYSLVLYHAPTLPDFFCSVTVAEFSTYLQMPQAWNLHQALSFVLRGCVGMNQWHVCHDRDAAHPFYKQDKGAPSIFHPIGDDVGQFTFQGPSGQRSRGVANVWFLCTLSLPLEGDSKYLEEALAFPRCQKESIYLQCFSHVFAEI